MYSSVVVTIKKFESNPKTAGFIFNDFCMSSSSKKIFYEGVFKSERGGCGNAWKRIY